MDIISRHIIDELKSNLQQIDSKEHDVISKTEQAVGICSIALLDLREYLNHSVFKNKEEEIRERMSVDI